jgi:nitrogen fixation/metabolism regulation signal transduction histidine kinase
LFFSFFPLREESSELLSRTKPDIRDVLIAFFGGLSLIIAKTKKGTISPVIFGVAIATALMPPLCTVGYGLAVGKIQFAIGAMYLFIINSLYIVLSTFLIVKLLRFPLINYVNSSKRRLISRIVTIFSILMLIPAIYTFLGVLYESKFNNSLKEFYEFELDGIKNKDYLIMNSKVEYDIGENNYIPWQDKLSVITFNSYGLEPVSKDIIAFLKTRVKKYPQLSLTSIVFNQQEIENDFKEQKRFLVELRKIDSLEISSKTKQIEQLENKLKEFEKVESLNVLYKTIIQDIKFNYEDIEEINLQNVISLVNSNDFEPIFLIKWKDSMLSQEILVQENKIREWLSFKLESESFQLKRLN